MIENDYLQSDYWHFLERHLSTIGTSPQEIRLGYLVIDVSIASTNGPTIRIPFTICSHFVLDGLKILGPFVAGHQAGLSMLQSQHEPKYARYYIAKEYSPLWDAEAQTLLISNALYSVIEDFDFFIPGLPDRGRTGASWLSSNIARVLMGGCISDIVLGYKEPRLFPGNPLRGTPFCIAPSVFRESQILTPEFYNDFTYYLISKSATHEFFPDIKLARTLDALRRAGPLYRAQSAGLSQGVLFDPIKNMEFANEFFSRFL